MHVHAYMPCTTAKEFISILFSALATGHGDGCGGCVNGGSCKPTGCDCPPDYGGLKCEKVRDCFIAKVHVLI